MALTVGSLFSGIGGIDLGLERAGMESRWFVEWDAHCRNVLARHWPGLPVYGDITTVDWGTVEPVDVLAGGFPCQPVSNAGKRLGTEDARWLWPEFARAIRALAPRYVLVENVAALLGRGFEHVITDLAALGYDAEWDCIPAAAIGAPHLRDRLWIVAYSERGRPQPDRVAGVLAGPSGPAQGEVGQRQRRRDAARDRGETMADSGSRRRGSQQRDLHGRQSDAAGSSPDVADAPRLGEREPTDEADSIATRREARHEPRHGGQSLAYPDSDGRGPQRDVLTTAWIAAPSGQDTLGRGVDRRIPGATDAGWWATEPDVGRVAHGVPHRVDRLRSLGNAVVPQVVEWIGRRIVAFDEERELRAA
jgi:DNA (cytosine-5)-methyltransferase 1